jgi:hypothetical protein
LSLPFFYVHVANLRCFSPPIPYLMSSVQLQILGFERTVKFR